LISFPWFSTSLEYFSLLFTVNMWCSFDFSILFLMPTTNGSFELQLLLEPILLYFLLNGPHW
jgi:hypothetical protein